MVRLIGFRLGCILIALKRCNLQLIIFGSFGDVGIAQQLRLLPLLFGVRLLNPCIPHRFRFGDFCIPLHSGNPRLPERFQIAVLIADILNGERDDLQPHFLQIASRNALHFLRKPVTVAIHFLHGHRSENRPQMTFKHFLGLALERLNRFAHELLGSCRHILGGAAHFDDRYTVRNNRNTLLGIHFRGRYIQLMGEQ
ncbi:hypothetical protein D3C73_954420 [compost metagenome]